MWRLDKNLVGQCVFVDQEVTFIGAAVVKVHSIYVAGKKVSNFSVSWASQLNSFGRV